MQADRISKFLKALGVNPQVSKDWVRGSCPFAPWTHDSGKDKNPSFGVEIDEFGPSHYFCFGCQKSGSLFDLLLELKMLLTNNAGMGAGVCLEEAVAVLNDSASTVNTAVLSHAQWEAEVQKPLGGLIPFPYEWLMSFPPATHVPEAVAYLHSRGVAPTTADQLIVRYDTTRKRVCFPIFGRDAQCYGMQGRDITGKNSLPYLSYSYEGHYNPSVWMGENWLDVTRPVILTEGPFDYASVVPWNSNVLASCTAALNGSKMARIADAPSIITAYDVGHGGDIARKYLTKWADSKNIHIHHLIPPVEYKDLGATPGHLIGVTLGSLHSIL